MSAFGNDLATTATITCVGAIWGFRALQKLYPGCRIVSKISAYSPARTKVRSRPVVRQMHETAVLWQRTRYRVYGVASRTVRRRWGHRITNGTLDGWGKSAQEPVPHPHVGRAFGFMSRTITTHHQWVIAATIDVPEPLARKGVQRGVVRIPAGQKIDVMETYCAMCRKTYEDVADVPCSAAIIGTEHLRGGPIGVRAKRTHGGAAAVMTQPLQHPPVVVERPAPVPVAVVAAPVPEVQPVAQKAPRPRRRPVPQSGAYTEWMLPFVVDATLTG